MVFFIFNANNCIFLLDYLIHNSYIYINNRFNILRDKLAFFLALKQILHLLNLFQYLINN